MPTRLPSLNALQAFEAAARHLSFTSAARDLHVTTAAVSHQVKQLEASLGLQLFERSNNRLRLTLAGETYAPEVREAFRRLHASTHHLIGASSVTLRVMVRAGFCQRWLLPRLPRFQAAHPQVHLDFDTEVDSDQLPHDIRIDYRPATAPNATVVLLFATPVYPVCAPALAARVKQPADLEHVPLLHDRPLQGMPEYPEWQHWLWAAGVRGLLNRCGATFNTSVAAMQAAEDGLGVALGQHALVASSITAGRLTAPLGQGTAMRLPYYLSHSPAASANPGLAALVQWLQAEAAQEG